jgi:hypothetical protein
MTCLTPRLFEPCKQDKHGECAVKLATYCCSCPCHPISTEDGALEAVLRPGSTTSPIQESVSNSITAVFKQLRAEPFGLTETLNCKHLRRNGSGTRDAL